MFQNLFYAPVLGGNVIICQVLLLTLASKAAAGYFSIFLFLGATPATVPAESRETPLYLEVITFLI